MSFTALAWLCKHECGSSVQLVGNTLFCMNRNLFSLGKHQGGIKLMG